MRRPQEDQLTIGGHSTLLAEVGRYDRALRLCGVMPLQLEIRSRGNPNENNRLSYCSHLAPPETTCNHPSLSNTPPENTRCRVLRNRAARTCIIHRVSSCFSRTMELRSTFSILSKALCDIPRSVSSVSNTNKGKRRN